MNLVDSSFHLATIFNVDESGFTVCQFFKTLNTHYNSEIVSCYEHIQEGVSQSTRLQLCFPLHIGEQHSARI